MAAPTTSMAQLPPRPPATPGHHRRRHRTVRAPRTRCGCRWASARPAERSATPWPPPQRRRASLRGAEEGRVDNGTSRASGMSIYRSTTVGRASPAMSSPRASWSPCVTSDGRRRSPPWSPPVATKRGQLHRPGHRRHRALSPRREPPPSRTPEPRPSGMPTPRVGPSASHRPHRDRQQPADPSRTLCRVRPAQTSPSGPSRSRAAARMSSSW